MSPEERQLLTGLLDRIKGAATTPRDPEAEALITNAVRAMPYAPYFLAQAVIVQNQALDAANQRIQELESQQTEQQPPPSGGFLSNLGAIFGGGPSSQQPPRAPSGPWQQGPQAYPEQPYPPQQQGGPWSGPPAGPPGGGGGFLHGALGTAAGVAGGVLLADSIRHLFTGGYGGLGGLGIGSGVAGLGGGLGGLGGGNETIVNNYYEDNGTTPANDFGSDVQPDGFQDTGYDDSDSGDFGSGDDGSFGV